jgi:exosortase C (VPDSG-CTERM-specific)
VGDHQSDKRVTDDRHPSIALDGRAPAQIRALPQRSRLAWYGLYLIVVAAAFGRPLAELLRQALDNELHSHIPLIPVISGYLLYIRHKSYPTDYRVSLPGTATLALLGAGALFAGGGLVSVTVSFICFVAAGGFFWLGARWMRAAAFPFAFLLFMMPIPEGLADRLETLSMTASADVASWFVSLTGTPLVRESQVFRLPGIALEIAQECSGIRSSWVLVITSVLAADLFLGSAWRRVLLVVFVVPLGIVRNGFRILVIAMMCVYVGPDMIESVVHRHGGPFFFALSLGPLFALLGWLKKQEAPR